MPRLTYSEVSERLRRQHLAKLLQEAAREQLATDPRPVVDQPEPLPDAEAERD